MAHLQQPPVTDRLLTPILSEPRYSQSLARGMAILESFSAEHPTLGIAQVAERVGMGRSTVHRYMSTLLTLGYLEQDRARKYRLTLRVPGLGMSALGNIGLAEHAHPYLQELRQRTSYTTGIAVLNGTEALYLERLPALRRGKRQVDLYPGSRLPLHCTAMGKVLLAYLPEHDQRDLLASLDLARRTPSTITTKTALRTELAQVTEEGIAVNDQELTPSTHAIAAPVRDQGEVVAAVCLAAHPSAISLPEIMEHLTPHLVSSADRISARLGYRRRDERNGRPWTQGA